VIDFYCPKAKLAIEIDGPSHFKKGIAEYDQARQEYIESLGITFLRFNNLDVYENLEGVMAVIDKKLNN
jgi:very-short-patch-repair endonuclease